MQLKKMKEQKRSASITSLLTPSACRWKAHLRNYVKGIKNLAISTEFERTRLRYVPYIEGG
ncbi:unnamed protein product [Orchesella dallaii]|uniref:Uncharacterized protein n=1 Tax=Orchesella dallaii TaxID=48710 RepID=A0ABP1S2X2_9HEXA